MTRLELFLSPGASSMAPHIALVEAGAEFTIRPLSFKAKDHRAPEYLAINPQGLVPTLLIDGHPLTESAAILFWTARHFPQASLLPDDAEGQAQVISWMSFLASAVQRAGREGKETGHAAYTLAERKLDGREWTVGTRLSISDIHLFRMFWRFHHLIGLERDQFPGLYALYDRMLQRLAVQRVIARESAIGYELPVPAPRP